MELEIHKGRTEVGVDLYSHGIFKTRRVGNRSVSVKGVLEQGDILLSIEQLKKLADAKTVDLRISGKDGHIDQELSLGYSRKDSEGLKYIHYNCGWDLDTFSDVKRMILGQLLVQKIIYLVLFSQKVGRIPLFSSQCMYYCFVERITCRANGTIV